MAAVTIRNSDPELKERLRVRAARNRRSMEAELRQILIDAVAINEEQELNLAEAVRRRVALSAV
jgi:plasmid stability protein